MIEPLNTSTLTSRHSAADSGAPHAAAHATEANRFATLLSDHGLTLRRSAPEILQLNIGKLCNLTCTHCHVNAGPKRKEIMTSETIDRILGWLAQTDIPTVDLTGGAPEMIPDFRRLVVAVRQMGKHVIDRCNLTILLEPGHEDLADFLQAHEVEVIASMPCYQPDNVNAQRGDGVFDASIGALQLLNRKGYGREPQLPLHLVYNPLGDSLPGPQAELEADYKRELHEHFGIVFHNLYTITNMPIARFASYLRHNDRLESYMALLTSAFNPAAVEGLMCRNTINVSWQGEVYDCDFNQMLDLRWPAEFAIDERADEANELRPTYLWELDVGSLAGRPIATGSHCLGCTAGAGSSCQGALDG